MSASAVIDDCSIVYVQKRSIPEQFYLASEMCSDIEACAAHSVHTVRPSFTEKERKARRGKWFMYKSQALHYPRLPAKLSPWIRFTDKEDGGVTLAHLGWAGRSSYPRLCYHLWGRAVKAREDILHRTNGEFLVRPTALFKLYPCRNYRRESLDAMPELSLQHFNEWEINSLTVYCSEAKKDGVFF